MKPVALYKYVLKKEVCPFKQQLKRKKSIVTENKNLFLNKMVK